jgi:hypothetical protein
MKSIRITILMFIVALAVRAETVDMVRWDAIRGFLNQAPTLETVAGPGAPKYQVFHLNTSPQEHAGDRYGLVRIKIPASGSYTLVMLFADVGNIVEYEIMPESKGAAPLRGNTRLIHPAFVDHDHEEAAELKDLTLPKPWDHFELHLLGFGPDLLKSANEYLIWFRFADKQPADVLMAATLLKGSADIVPEKLPAVFGLPEHKHE